MSVWHGPPLPQGEALAALSSEAPKPRDGNSLPLAQGGVLTGGNGDPGDEQPEPIRGVMRQLARGWLVRRWLRRLESGDASPATYTDQHTESPRESGGE